ncbi:DUF4942 domain-containing protein [Methylosinus sporium]|nr:DUF4942 domain-containing protein [Methylosinus sporium]
MTAALPVPRQTIEDIVRAHDETLELYERAFSAMEIADEALQAAHRRAHDADGGQLYVFGGSSNVDEIQQFRNALVLPKREHYMRTARKLLANGTWANLVKMTELMRLMDNESKEQLRAQMNYVPDKVTYDGEVINQAEIDKGLPPITVGNVYATLEKFIADSGMIFRRGIANVFSKLDRRFKSHDGFKIGGRIILRWVFDGSGYLNSGAIRDKLIDVERVFSVLDGVAEADFQSALKELAGRKVRGTTGGAQSEHETPYFKIRAFKNGNAHLWFTRDDLVEKVNKLLAEYYGEVVGDARTADDDPLENRKMTPAKDWGFFPTPDKTADDLIEFSPLRTEGVSLRILEPSAGTGNLARRMAAVRTASIISAGQWIDKRYAHTVDCVEIQPHLAHALTELRPSINRIVTADFLTLPPDPIYDRVVMNPPFDRERDIDHVTHAWKFLKPGGCLTAIMSAGTEFRETRKALAFRVFVETRKSEWRDLPAGSFAECGTNVNVVMVKIWKGANEQ